MISSKTARKVLRGFDGIEKQVIVDTLPSATKNPILELGCETGHWSL